MEKYVFDCRKNLNSTPKYLKRNQNLSKHHQQVPFQNLCLKDKVFVTFDYSYYHQILPKTTSFHGQNRINNLNSLLNPNALISKQIQIDHDKFEFSNRLKWRIQSNNLKGHRFHNCQSHLVSKHPKKAKSTLFCQQPGVGDYEIKTDAVYKKITKNVKIRGKTTATVHKQNVGGQKGEEKENTRGIELEKGVQTAKHLTNYHKESRNIKKVQTKEEQQFWKFINNIDIKTVWRNLSKKHKLKTDFVVQ